MSSRSDVSARGVAMTIDPEVNGQRIEGDFVGNGGRVEQVADTSNNSHLDWADARKLLVPHGEFTRVEEGLIRKRALGWKVKGSFVDDVPLDILVPVGKQLTEFDMTDIRAIVAEHNRYIEPLLDATLELARGAYRDYFEGEKFIRVVEGVELPEAPSTSGSEFWTDADLAVPGWRVRFAFRSIDYPVLNDHFKQLKLLRQERQQAVDAYIAAMK